MDELDRIIANLSEGVKYKNEVLEEGIKNTNWKKIEALEPLPQTQHIKNDPIGQVNKAYKAIEGKVQLNKLTDTFRVSDTKTPQSGTAESLKKTIERFTRQHTIIQAFG